MHVHPHPLVVCISECTCACYTSNAYILWPLLLVAKYQPVTIIYSAVLTKAEPILLFVVEMSQLNNDTPIYITISHLVKQQSASCVHRSSPKDMTCANLNKHLASQESTDYELRLIILCVECPKYKAVQYWTLTELISHCNECHQDIEFGLCI